MLAAIIMAKAKHNNHWLRIECLNGKKSAIHKKTCLILSNKAGSSLFDTGNMLISFSS